MKDQRSVESGAAIRSEVRRYYGDIATRGSGCGCDSSCGGDAAGCANDYSPAELASDAAAANLGLGCGNPLIFASLSPGEVVLDLGSGAGFDVFLAAERVGPNGRAIGVDMTPAMTERARGLAQERRVSNVEFRLGEIERLPVETASIDVIISNCVINLSPDKEQVFREAFRVLKPGGRIAVSDIIALSPLPAALRADLVRYVECVSGAVEEGELRRLLEGAGFAEIAFEYPNGQGANAGATGDALRQVASAVFRAVKPSAGDSQPPQSANAVPKTE